MTTKLIQVGDYSQFSRQRALFTVSFPVNARRVTVKKGAMTGVELMGFDKDPDREALDSILQEVWEDESWR
ncbi:Hypothetical protein SeGA_5497 [Salmonella enterica subsp. enterica serovar Gaminara str. A4-567]|nr:Hypothetical protein SeGA_5497 [Salmonella enterica subsp. enterica serovar Gaminara str. A4-567]